jgi:hypothetical protein
LVPGIDSFFVDTLFEGKSEDKALQHLDGEKNQDEQVESGSSSIEGLLLPTSWESVLKCLSCHKSFLILAQTGPGLFTQGLEDVEDYDDCTKRTDHLPNNQVTQVLLRVD